MSGILPLSQLLTALSPQLDEGKYVFCSLNKNNLSNCLALQPLAMFRENEGISLILDKTTADEQQITYQAIFSRITLQLHSSLEAVGLTAAVTTQLTRQNISANVVAGYYHDHIFVPEERAREALHLLTDLTNTHEPGNDVA